MPSLSDNAKDYYNYETTEETKSAFGTVGAVAINTAVATISNPGADGGRGWYKIWGHGRHDAADGLRLQVGATEKVRFASAANELFYFGPYLVEITNDTDDIIIETAAATTAVASVTVYAKRTAD